MDDLARIDAATLDALDEWMALRGPQRALPHPRQGRSADFLFVHRGRRLSAYRLRHGLDNAARAAGLRGSASPMSTTTTTDTVTTLRLRAFLRTLSLVFQAALAEELAGR